MKADNYYWSCEFRHKTGGWSHGGDLPKVTSDNIQDAMKLNGRQMGRHVVYLIFRGKSYLLLSSAKKQNKSRCGCVYVCVRVHF